MNAMLLAFLLGMILSPSPAYDVAQFGDAIIATGHGEPLTWYTPRVEIAPIHGAPAGWKGVTNCWPPVYSGVVYVNPQIQADVVAMTVMHELVHLHNNCHGAEWETELAAMDAMAYLGRRDEVLANLIRRLQPPDNLSDAIVREYYTIPAGKILRDELGEYPYLREMLIEAGVIEEECAGMR